MPWSEPGTPRDGALLDTTNGPATSRIGLINGREAEVCDDTGEPLLARDGLDARAGRGAALALAQAADSAVDAAFGGVEDGDGALLAGVGLPDGAEDAEVGGAGSGLELA